MIGRVVACNGAHATIAAVAEQGENGHNDNCFIDKLTQDETIDVAIHIPTMLSEYFAIVGSTGIG